MESLDAPAGFMDELLDFASDIGEEGEEEEQDDDDGAKTLALPFPLLPKTSGVVEEELEWISNEDAFPMVESFVDIPPNHHPSPTTSHRSPVSVLDSSTSGFTSTGIAAILSRHGSLKVPVRARSKRRKRRRELFGGSQWQCWAKVARKTGKQGSTTLGRKCLHCQAEKTPQWRAGPMGPKTLCNACGVRFKSGRLVPEYRPASSPTFSGEVHSNSHRKIMEMRRQKQMVREWIA